MRKIRDILRLRLAAGLTIRQIKNSTKASIGAIQKLLTKAEALGLGWPLPDDMDDKKLAELPASLEKTRLYYGDAEAKESQKRKNASTRKLHDELSEAALARRAIFNATASGKSNLLGKGELVEAISSGRMELDDIDRDDMPASLQALAPEEQMEIITEQARRRDKIKSDIRELSESRSLYIRQKIAAQGDASESLDEKIYSAVKKQAKLKGLIYESESASY